MNHENTMRHGFVLHQPATRWKDALPSGNGTLGALVFGNIHHETIVLNHEQWWQGSVTPTLPNLASHLPELRQLLKAGQYQKANAFFPDLLRQAGYNAQPGSFQPGLELKLSMPLHSPFSNYQRTLNFLTGESVVSWQDADIHFERRLFVSRPDRLIALNIRASQPGRVNLILGLDLPAFDNRNPVKHSESAYQSLWTVRSDGTAFGGGLRVFVKNGAIVEENISDEWSQGIAITNADEVTVLIDLFTSGDPAESLKAIQNRLDRVDSEYSLLLDRHEREHRRLFDRMKFDLKDKSSERQQTNEQLLTEAYANCNSNTLMEKMFDYGRYLLISSSSPGGLPAHLQGLWNHDPAPAWCSAYFNNENIQMNYWQALAGNLPETLLPLFDLYEKLLPDFQENARKFFGCRGILVPLYLAPDSGLKKDLQSHVVYWTAGGGWIAQFFYDYWLFTGDREFLEKRAIPFMKEVAAFYEDFLVTDADGRFCVMPSNSPENCANGSFTGAGELPICINATMDIAIAKETLTKLIAACYELRIEAENVSRWQSMLEKLPPYQINPDGAIREWMHPDFLDNYHHRHQSHLYPVFPGREITSENNSMLFEACRVAVEKRLVVGLGQQTGWSLSHMANIYARLGQGDRAIECLEILSRTCLGPNFFTYHNDWRKQGITLDMNYPGIGSPFQIDANFGWTAAILEMLVFSEPSRIKLLPALPGKWTCGEIHGLCCRGGIQLDLAWDMKKPSLKVTLRSQKDQEIMIQLPSFVQKVQVKHGQVELEPPIENGFIKNMKIPAGKSVYIWGADSN
jgi:alpha-L-fucosidase 2